MKIAMVFVIMVVLVVGSMATFHFARGDGRLAVFPKRNISFADTFLEVNSVINRYNSESFADKLRRTDHDNYIIKKLKEKGFITEDNPFEKLADKYTSSLGDYGGSSRQATQQPDWLTREKANRIKEGMSYQKVINILGRHGTEASRVEIGSNTTVAYEWTGDRGGILFIMFSNGRVYTKSYASFN